MERRQVVQVLRTARFRLVLLLQLHPHYEQFQSKLSSEIISSIRIAIEKFLNIVCLLYIWYTSILPKTSETPHDQ
jgi:hypothetical protein